MSESWNILTPMPRTSYLLCKLFAVPLWLLSVILPFVLVGLLVIPFANSPIIIIPAFVALPILFISYQISRTVILWILNWLAALWRQLRKSLGAVAPSVKIQPNCATFGNNLTILLEADNLDAVKSVNIRLLDSYTGDVEAEQLEAKYPFASAIIRPMMRIVSAIDGLLPKPNVVDTGRRSQDLRFAKQTVKESITGTSLTIDLPVPTQPQRSKAFPPNVYGREVVLYLKVKSKGMANFVEYYHLPMC